MKQTKTEIYIEVEEIVEIRTNRKNQAADIGRETDEREKSNRTIEICPHCGGAIFGRETIEIEGERKI